MIIVHCDERVDGDLYFNKVAPNLRMFYFASARQRSDP